MKDLNCETKAAREPEVREQINRTKGAVGDLTDRISGLIARLDTVLRKDSPPPTVEDKNPESVIVPFAEEIRTDIYRPIRNQVKRIEDILNTIEL